METLFGFLLGPTCVSIAIQSGNRSLELGFVWFWSSEIDGIRNKASKKERRTTKGKLVLLLLLSFSLFPSPQTKSGG